jgi:hypothetical protein
MNLPCLPSEIVMLIAEFLGDDWHSMLNFYKANKSTRHALSSRLYRSVHLKSSKSIKSLCQVSTTFRYVELRNIRSLQIGLSWCTYSASFQLPNDLVSSFRSALKGMPALLSLSLHTVPSVLDSLLEGFDPPFQLTELIHSGKLSSELAGFLQRQPSIVRLGWYSLLVDEQPAYLSKLLENELFLPALNELAGPLPLLSVVIPRRFITKIQVMYHTLAFLRLEGSMAAFSHPMGRLSSLCIVEHRPSWQGCMTLICNLKATHARHTLKDIHIVEAFMVSFCSHGSGEIC